MKESHEPSRKEATKEMGLHLEDFHDKGYDTTPKNNAVWAVSWIFLCGLVSVGVLVCLSLAEWPWQLQWLEEGRLSLIVIDSLVQLNKELAGVALVVFSALFLIAARSVEINDSVASAKNTQYSIDWDRLDNNGEAGRSEAFDAHAQSALIREFSEELAEQSRLDQIIDLDVINACDPAHDYQRKSYASEKLSIATSELSRVRAELVASQLQLNATNKAQARFMSSISHELRTPMSGIIGMTDLLLGEDLAAREERFVRSIAESSNSLLVTMNDLLDFTNIESGGVQLDNKRFSLKDCIEDVCASLSGTAKDKQIELICTIDEAIPEQVEGDSSRVSQVLHNLIANAISSTSIGQVVVRLTCKERSNGLSVYQCDVQDTGVGISPEEQLYLFEAMTHANSTSVQTRCANGMGLVISTELLAMMNGELTFKSRLGEGSQFSFTVEMADVAEISGRDSAYRDASADYSQLGSMVSTLNLKVLLVEDNPDGQNAAIDALEQLGCYVTLATNGEQAVKMGSQQKYDVVLMDCQMPNMGGFTATRLIKSEGALNASTPVIALTTPALSGRRNKFLSAGMNDYVSKPVEQEVLSHMLQKWVGHTDASLAKHSASASQVSEPVGIQCDLVLARLTRVDLDLGDSSQLDEVHEARVKSSQLSGSVGVPIHQSSLQVVPEAFILSVKNRQKESNVSPINLKAIDTIRGLQRVGKSDLLTKIVGVYFDKTPEIIDAMEDCLKEADLEGLSSNAHSLQFSSAYLGAESLSQACQLIEAAVRDKDSDHAAKLVAGIRCEYERVSGALDSLVKAA